MLLEELNVSGLRKRGGADTMNNDQKCADDFPLTVPHVWSIEDDGQKMAVVRQEILHDSVVLGRVVILRLASGLQEKTLS